MIRCPYNDVVSFIYRYKGKKENKNVKILELGSGDGNNIWYLKKENFNVKGIELDSSRIENAHNRLKEDNLHVDIVKGSFTNLPFNDNEFDLVFDRGAVTCVSIEDARKVISEVNRVLKKDGFFYFNPYSELDNNFFEGTILEDGRVGNFKNALKKYEGIQFYSVGQILEMFKKEYWEFKEFNLLSKKELITSRKLNVNTFEIILKNRRD